MKLNSKTYSGILLILMISMMIPGQVQAHTSDKNNDSLLVSITKAVYIDLDLDGQSDDILTEFDIATPAGEWNIYLTIIFCELILPSGYAFYFFTFVKGDYAIIETSLGWFNCAVEEGWYLIRVHALALGPDAPNYDCGETLFDPPDGGIVGPPEIAIINQTIIE